MLNDIVKACQKLYEKGFVANHDGNITVRLNDGTFLATPTSFSKGDIQASDILKIDASGQVISGPHKVFSEITWHLAIYRARPDVRCVVHAHPPIAGGMALAGCEIGTPGLPEAIVSLGRCILTAKFLSPTDPNLSSALEAEARRCLGESDAMVVPGNGAWTVGQEVMQAYYRMELIEHIAHQHFVAAQLGEVRRLPSSVVEELLKKRPKTVASAAPVEKLAYGGAIPSRASGSISGSAAAAGSPPAFPEKAQLREIVRQELEKLLK